MTQQTPNDMSTSERMATLARASADAMKHKMRGEGQTQEGVRYTIPPADVAAIIEDWPTAPKKCAEQMLTKYGPPNEATATKLFWHRCGPWKRILVTRDIVAHNFPAPHSDFLTQWIDYHVPTDKFDELGRYDGSCLVDRTAGEVAARCDSEAANFITLNFMHEIVSGLRTVDEARKAYAEQMAAWATGREAPYAERFLFTVPQADTPDPDQSMMAGAMARQMAGKVADMTKR